VEGLLARARIWCVRAVTRTSCLMPSITCRARWPTTVCRSCAGLEPVLGPVKPDPGTDAISSKCGATSPKACQAASQIPATVQLGRGQHRGGAELLPTAAAAPQAHEFDQHARTLEPGTEASHPHTGKLLTWPSACSAQLSHTRCGTTKQPALRIPAAHGNSIPIRRG
jgi:hypothetical protein